MAASGTTSAAPGRLDPSTIHRRIVSGAGWMLAFRLGDRAIGLVSMVVLARLLTPRDFGLVALATSLLAVLELFGDLGLDLELIRNQKAGRQHYDTAWTLELLKGIAAAGLLAGLAAPAAAFFKDPRVEPIVYWLAVASVLTGCENIATVDFRKNLEFRREVTYLLVSRLVSTSVAILLAVAWREYWALVAGILAHRLTRLGLSYALLSFRPRLGLAAAGEIFRFSRWIVLRNVLLSSRRRAPAFVIGRLSGPAALALYDMAFELANLVTTEFRAPVRRALFPGYAKLGADRGLLRASFVETFAVLVLIGLPVPVGLGLTAQAFVPVLLGPGWLDTIPLIQVLSIHGVVQCLSLNSQLVYLALNRPQIASLLSGIHLAAFLPLLIVGDLWGGVAGAAWGTVGASLVTMLVDVALLTKILGVPMSALARASWRAAAATAIMAAAVWLAQNLPGALTRSAAASLIVGIVTGVVSYWLAVAGLWCAAGRPAGAERQLVDVLRRWRATPASP